MKEKVEQVQSEEARGASRCLGLLRYWFLKNVPASNFREETHLREFSRFMMWAGDGALRCHFLFMLRLLPHAAPLLETREGLKYGCW